MRALRGSFEFERIDRRGQIEMFAELREELTAAIKENRIVLPTLPEVALQVREAAEDPNIDAAGIAEVLSTDGALSARVVRVANSPLLRAASPITDLKMAVSRLGINYSCNLATGLAVEQMFQATTDAVDRRMRQNWRKSTEVAGIASVLARSFARRLKPDQATLAGLVHRLGALPILRFAEEDRRLVKMPELLDQLIADLHGEIGKLILEIWDFPEELSIVPIEYQNYTREREEADYADIVMVANLQSGVGDEQAAEGVPDWSEISAFDRLGISPEINVLEVEDLSEAMEASIASLQ